MLFPIVAVLISIATHRCASSLVSIPSPTRTVFCSVVAAVLTGGRRSRVVLIVCISPMTGDLSTVFRGVRGNWGLHKQLFHARVCAALRTIRDKCWSSPHTHQKEGDACVGQTGLVLPVGTRRAPAPPVDGGVTGGLAVFLAPPISKFTPVSSLPAAPSSSTLG